MIKCSLILFILLFSSVLMASNETIKTEYEFKVSLTKAGFEKFKKLFIDSFQAKESSRVDLYFDIFESHKFILKNLSEPIKLRFQDSKWQIQNSVTLPGLGAITAKKSQSQSIDVDGDEIRKIHDDITEFHRELLDLNPRALETAVKIKERLLELKLLKNATQLCSLCTEDKAYYSTQTNQKTRYKMKIKKKGFEFTLFVGVTVNTTFEAYELEAELQNSEDSKNALAVIADWLNTQGLKALDVLSTDLPNPILSVEQNLNLILSSAKQ